MNMYIGDRLILTFKKNKLKNDKNLKNMFVILYRLFIKKKGFIFYNRFSSNF